MCRVSLHLLVRSTLTFDSLSSRFGFGFGHLKLNLNQGLDRLCTERILYEVDTVLLVELEESAARERHVRGPMYGESAVWRDGDVWIHVVREVDYESIGRQHQALSCEVAEENEGILKKSNPCGCFAKAVPSAPCAAPRKDRSLPILKSATQFSTNCEAAFRHHLLYDHAFWRFFVDCKLCLRGPINTQSPVKAAIRLYWGLVLGGNVNWAALGMTGILTTSSTFPQSRKGIPV